MVILATTRMPPKGGSRRIAYVAVWVPFRDGNSIRPQQSRSCVVLSTIYLCEPPWHQWFANTRSPCFPASPRPSVLSLMHEAKQYYLICLEYGNISDWSTSYERLLHMRLVHTPQRTIAVSDLCHLAQTKHHRCYMDDISNASIPRCGFTKRMKGGGPDLS